MVAGARFESARGHRRAQRGRNGDKHAEMENEPAAYDAREPGSYPEHQRQVTTEVIFKVIDHLILSAYKTT
jgi:hypothetical protein